MAILGLITDEGLRKSAEAQGFAGWKIYPESFGVSSEKGALEESRDYGSRKPVWYSAAISGSYFLDNNSLIVFLTIPPLAVDGDRLISEIYLVAKDNFGDEFLLAFAQFDPVLEYMENGSLTVRLLLTAQNLDFSSFLEFKYTQAEEIAQHNINDDSHPYLRDLLARRGITAFASENKFLGQGMDPFPSFAYSSPDNGDLVYLDGDAYRRAIGTIPDNAPVGLVQKVTSGMSAVVTYHVIYSGLADIPGLDAGFGVPLFLDPAIGRLTTSETAIPIGFGLSGSRLWKMVSLSGGNVPFHNLEPTAHPPLLGLLRRHGIVYGAEGLASTGLGQDSYPAFAYPGPESGDVVYRLAGSYYKVVDASLGASPPLGVVDRDGDNIRVIFGGIFEHPSLVFPLGAVVYLGHVSYSLSTVEDGYPVGLGLGGNRMLVGSAPDLSGKTVGAHNYDAGAHPYISDFLKNYGIYFGGRPMGHLPIDPHPTFLYDNPAGSDAVVLTELGYGRLDSGYVDNTPVGVVESADGRLVVVFNGFAALPEGLAATPGQKVYATDAGRVTLTKTAVPIGYAVTSGRFFVGLFPGADELSVSEHDADLGSHADIRSLANPFGDDRVYQVHKVSIGSLPDNDVLTYPFGLSTYTECAIVRASVSNLLSAEAGSHHGFPIPCNYQELGIAVDLWLDYDNDCLKIKTYSDMTGYAATIIICSS
jgi:hypothetical protein